MNSNRNGYLVLNDGLRFVAGPKRSAIYEMRTGRIYSVDPFLTRVLSLAARGLPLAEIPKRLRLGASTPKRRMLEAFLHHPFVRLAGRPAAAPEAAAAAEIAPARRHLDFLWVELTATCNLRCRHCYASSGPDRPPGAMTGEDYRRILKEAGSMGCRTVQLTGGEIFLRPDLIELIETARAAGVADVELYTNATLIRDADLDTLEKLAVRFAVSLYSHRPEPHDAITRVPGSWRRTVATIERILERRLPIRVGVVRMEENWDDAEPTRRFLRDLGVGEENMRFDTVRPSGRGCEGSLGDPDRNLVKLGPPTRFEPDAGRLTARTCWSGKLAIDPEGMVFPCVFSRNLPVGNVRQSTLAEVIGGEAARDLWSITLEKVEDCRDCEYRYACFDCRLQAYAYTGRMLAKPPTCSYLPHDGAVEEAEGMPVRAERLTPSLVPRPRRTVALRRVGGETYLWDRESQAMHVINPTAARIWEWCDGETSRDEIVGRMCEMYHAGRDRIERDVGRTLASFQELGLME